MEQQVISEPKFKLMVVSNTTQLNVRQTPDPKAVILMTLNKDQKVNINLMKSTDSYFYVASIVDEEKKIPVHGFCKREFILE